MISAGSGPRVRSAALVLLVLLLAATSSGWSQAPIDLLLTGGRVLDGAGNPWVVQDIGVRGDRIVFVGHAKSAGITARDTVDVSGLVVTPGFIDAHSHAELEEPYGRDALPFLFQGITTVVLGVDGGGTNAIRETFATYRANSIGVNVIRFVGHGAARREVMGSAARAPTPTELDAMKAYIRRGMEEGAVGISTGLFYSPGTFATTDEVVEVTRVAAEYGGIYDTHDRDLGASYPGIGFLNSMREAIEIGERAGTPVIFSHLSPQGRQNYGRANQAAALIDSARARGVNVMAAHHPYTATQSNLRSYTVPDWAAAGGEREMLARFQDPETVKRLDDETMRMLAIRGGAEKILFADPRPSLNGKTLAEVATGMGLPVPATVRTILAEGNASVMNLDLYDTENIKYLAQREWMMTCSDGRTPPPGADITHPRPFGAFPRKLRMVALDDSLVSLPFVVRGMTSLATTFFGIPDRGLVRPGSYADLAIFDLSRVRDRATFEDPHQYAEGAVHVLVNGRFAIRDGKATNTLAGKPLPRGG
jgi:N-acyl-D-amino-acid deacylase